MWHPYWGLSQPRKNPNRNPPGPPEPTQAHAARCGTAGRRAPAPATGGELGRLGGLAGRCAGTGAPARCKAARCKAARCKAARTAGRPAVRAPRDATPRAAGVPAGHAAGPLHAPRARRDRQPAGRRAQGAHRVRRGRRIRPPQRGIGRLRPPVVRRRGPAGAPSPQAPSPRSRSPRRRAAEQPTGSAPPESDDFTLELPEEEQPVEQGEPTAESRPERPERRRGRRGRSRGRDRGPVRDAAIPAPAVEDRPPLEEDLDDTTLDLPDPLGDETDDEASAAVGFHSIPTWEEAVGILVSANLESRARRPGNGAASGRGGNRGGRDRNRGGGNRGSRPRSANRR